MKLIIGLGNPGTKYQNTRHNLGFVVMDALVNKLSPDTTWTKGVSVNSLVCEISLNGEKIRLVKPQTFMNNSGLSAKEEMNYLKIAPQDIWIVHDDLDLELGRIKSDFNASSAGHRGVQSIIDELGTKEFNRVRLGIGHPIDNIPVEDYVLQKFGADEMEMVNKMIEEAVKLILKSEVFNFQVQNPKFQ